MDNEIRSAPAAEVSSEGLATLLRLLQEANNQRRALRVALPEVEEEEFRLSSRYEKRRDGFLLKRLFPAQLSRFEREATQASAEAKELRDQLQQAMIRTEIQIPEKLEHEYLKVRQAFAALCECQSIWDVVADRKVNSLRERSDRGRAVAREKVHFEFSSSETLAYAEAVPVLRNRNGGDLFLYPGFVLFVEGPTEFGLIDLRDISIVSRTVRSMEEGAVPSDAERVGTTWLRVNADGSPDRRYGDNRELPVVAYGSIRLQSKSGLNEEYQFSNVKLATEFGAALQEFVSVTAKELGPLPETVSSQSPGTVPPI